MNSESALLNGLRDCRDFQGMFRQFACFLQPFEDFVYIDYYNPVVIKKSEESFTPKELTTEKIRSLAGQFNQFFPKVLKLLAKLLRRSPDGERMREENVTELFGIYRLTIHCLLCTAPCLTDEAYSVHVNWCELVHLLKTWKKYNDAEEECYALLENLNSFLVTPPSPSPSADSFPMDRRLSFLVEVLKMTLEVSFCEDKIDFTNYVKTLLLFISNCTMGFSEEACNDGLILSSDNSQEALEALELCCKTIWKHIKLLCQPYLKNFKRIQRHVASRDLIKDVIKDALTKCSSIIDVLHNFGADNAREVLVKSLSEMRVVEVSFPNHSLSFPLMKQWVKMLFKDFSDVNEVDDVPFLYSLLHCESTTWPKNILGEILEQELQAYDQLEPSNLALCHKMEIKIIDKLLMNVFDVIDFNLQRARVLVRKALVLRAQGIENLNSCFDCLDKSISLLDNVTYDSSKANTLRSHQLVYAYFLRAQFSHELKKNWEIIQGDIQHAINLISKLDFEAYNTLSGYLKPNAKSTISILCHTLDLLSLKGCLKFHFDIHTLIKTFYKIENFSVEKYLAMLWTGRRLGHSLCASPIDPDLISRISQLCDDNLNSFAFWTECLKSSSYSLLMFIPNILFSDSILNDEIVHQSEALYSCKLTVEGVQMAASSLLLDVPTKNEISFAVGQIYYDLAKRLFAGGRVFEGLSYAKKALNLRHKDLQKKFNVPSKGFIELSDSLKANSEHKYLYPELFGSAINGIWRDTINLERCILSPWIILNCYLESILQVGILYEAIGDGVRAEIFFILGRNFSIFHFLPNFQIAFNCALGKLCHKKLLWPLVKDELTSAMKALQQNDILISCKHCKLIYEVTIKMQIADLNRKFPNKGFSVQSKPLDIYRSVVRNLSNYKVESSHIASWKLQSIGVSSSKCHFQDTKHRVKNNSKSHPLESDERLPFCHICSFLAHSFDAQKVEQQSLVMTFFDDKRGVYPTIECLKCVWFKVIKEGDMQNIINFKRDYQRRRLLLRLLLKITKSLEAPGEKQKAHEVHDVFWQCIYVLFDGKPCYDANSHNYDLNLFKLIGDYNIWEMFSIERATLLYNMSWFFLKNSHPNDMSTKCCSLSNVLMQDIFSMLLRTFIFCREIPKLYQKVSRLIASLILLSTINDLILPPPLCSRESLSKSHWAAFFHQASIGFVVNYQYLSFIQDKGLKRENVLETDTNINYISRYTPEELENLGEFVEGFFNGLPRISIICISLLNGDYINLLGKVLSRPSFFSAWLLITRFDSNRQPIVMFFPVNSILKGFDSCKKFMLENKLSVADWFCPWSSAMIDDLTPSYKLILASNKLQYSNPDFFGPGSLFNQSKWHSNTHFLYNELNILLRTIEDKWIGLWGCLLLGERLDVKSLETFSARISSCLNSQSKFMINENLIKVILSGSRSVSDAEACISMALSYKGFFGRGGCCGEKGFKSFANHSKGVECMLASIHNLISEAVGEGLTVDRQPVIIVLDTDVQMISWENMPILNKQEVYRMPSVGSILLKLNHTSIKKKNASKVELPQIDVSRSYYLLNPTGEFNRIQHRLEKLFQNYKWEGKAGKKNIPTTEELFLALQNHDLYLYFGHGSGMKYMDVDSFGELNCCAAAFLIGCSSGVLKQRGSYAPRGAPLTYLFAGSPIVIANLWEVEAEEMYQYVKNVLNSWMQNSILLDCNKCGKLRKDCNEGKVIFPTKRKASEVEGMVGKEKCRHCDVELRVASFLSKAREACTLTTLTGAAVVCYGVPTILKRR